MFTDNFHFLQSLYIAWASFRNVVNSYTRVTYCITSTICERPRVMYDSYLLKDVHSVLVNFPREYAQESMMLYI